MPNDAQDGDGAPAAKRSKVELEEFKKDLKAKVESGEYECIKYDLGTAKCWENFKIVVESYQTQEDRDQHRPKKTVGFARCNVCHDFVTWTRGSSGKYEG